MNREQRRKLAKMKVARPTIDAYEFERQIRERLADGILADKTELLTEDGKLSREVMALHFANLIRLPKHP